MEGIVEADETYIGGENKNRHADKKIPYSQGRTLRGKIGVFGMIERGGRVSAMRVLGTGRNDLQPLILKTVKKGVKLMTDDWRAYTRLKEFYVHDTINHSVGEYVDGDCHTNTIEGFWSMLKRGWIGVYHFWSAKHIDSYLDEYEYRYNTRNLGEFDRFANLLNLSEGRLTYENLIK